MSLKLVISSKRFSSTILHVLTTIFIVWIVFACSMEPGSRVIKHPIIKMALETPEDYSNKKAALKNRDGMDHLKREHWRKAAADFRRAITIDPGLAVAHFNLGLVLSQSGKDSEAAEHIKRAMDLDPNHPKIFPLEIIMNRIAKK